MCPIIKKSIKEKKALSFSTNAFLMNIPTISIKKITGHRTEKAFMKYIKISQAENANKLTNHPFFN